MSDAAKRQGMPDDLTKPNETQGLTPEQVRVVALRVQGHRWSEIAAKLGVTAWTVWSWRQQHPEIDQLIAQDANDYLVSTRHKLSTLLPLGALRLEELLKTRGACEPKDVIAANKMLAEVFKAIPANTPPPPPQAKPKIGETQVVPDAELDRVLDAELSEPDQREPTR